MRLIVVLGASALALAACQKKEETAAATGEPAAAKAPAGPMTPPKRKAGLWAQTMVAQGMTQTTKFCTDAAVEAKMSVWGQQMGQDMCAKNLITPAAGGWSFESECDMGQGGKVATKGSATGDFNSRYVIKATSVTTGSAMPQANGTHEMQMTAAWEGPCPAGMKPGDMQLPGGMTVNIANLPGGMSAKK